jgi:hypothetical protein
VLNSISVKISYPITCCAEIIESQIDLVNLGNKYGPIRSASIVLRGPAFGLYVEDIKCRDDAIDPYKRDSLKLSGSVLHLSEIRSSRDDHNNLQCTDGFIDVPYFQRFVSHQIKMPVSMIRRCGMAFLVSSLVGTNCMRNIVGLS